MKKLVTFLLFCLALNSCFPTENDTNKNCIENCTTFSGQIKTVDEIGIPKVNLTLDYHIGGELSSYTRIIGKLQPTKMDFMKCRFI